MNLLGKIFVGLILVLSVVFMGFSVAVYATHKNWYDAIYRKAPGPHGEPIGLQIQLDEKKKQYENLQAQFNSLQAELATEKAMRRQQLAKLQDEKSTLDKEYNRLAQQEADLIQREKDAAANVKTAQATLDSKLQEIDLLRKEIDDARQARDDRFQEVVKLTDDLHQAEGEAARLKERSLYLGEQIAKANNVLMRNGLSAEMPLDGTPPKLDGIVLASGANGMVEISLGSDDGVAKGNTFEVFRAATSKYLGRVEVLQVLPDKSVAKIIPEYRKGPIAKEDRVATRLD